MASSKELRGAVSARGRVKLVGSPEPCPRLAPPLLSCCLCGGGHRRAPGTKGGGALGSPGLPASTPLAVSPTHHLVHSRHCCRHQAESCCWDGPVHPARSTPQLRAGEGEAPEVTLVLGARARGDLDSQVGGRFCLLEGLSKPCTERGLSRKSRCIHSVNTDTPVGLGTLKSKQAG